MSRDIHHLISCQLIGYLYFQKKSRTCYRSSLSGDENNIDPALTLCYIHYHRAGSLRAALFEAHPKTISVFLALETLTNAPGHSSNFEPGKTTREQD
jgi:hypothetical protein